MAQPLILDAVGAALSLLQLWEYLENIEAEFRSEGAELGEVSELPLEEAEVLEQPSDGVLGEASGWKERAVALGTAGKKQCDSVWTGVREQGSLYGDF